MMPPAAKPMRMSAGMVVARRGMAAQHERADSHAAQPEVDERGVLHLLRSGGQDVDTGKKADANHGAGDTEDLLRGVQVVAHVDGDHGREAAKREHAGRQRGDDEEKGGVMQDEVGALTHVGENATKAAEFVGSAGCLRHHRAGGDGESNGGDERCGGRKADGVADVTDSHAEYGDDGDSDGAADDAHDEHHLLHQRIGGAQAVKGNRGAKCDALGR